jgi:hypothetical protein
MPCPWQLRKILDELVWMGRVIRAARDEMVPAASANDPMHMKATRFRRRATGVPF